MNRQHLLTGAAALAAFDGLSAGATVEQLNKALGESLATASEEVRKNFTFSQPGSPTTGLQGYDLEGPAKLLYPVLTPLRNETPRVSGKGGSQANWKAVTAINTGKIRIGVSEGKRGGTISVQTRDYAAAYKGIGVESSVSFEADYAAKGFDDVRARAARSGLESLMLGEEVVILGGNGSLELGVTPTPALVGAGSGGSLAAATWSVICVALTLEGYLNASIADGIPTEETRVNADGSTDTYGGGSAQKSVAATVVTSGSASKINGVVTAVRGASAYAWFWGLAGSELLGAITTAPKVEILAAATGTQNASEASQDNSTNNLIFDGLITQACKAGSNAYVKDLGGVALTADGAAGIVEFDEVLKDRWDNFKLSPDTIWISSSTAISLAQKLLDSGTSQGAYRIVVNPEQGAIMGGVMVATYLNKFSMSGANTLKVRIHPNMPAGTILFTTSRIPYPLSNVGNVWQIKTRQDYYQIEWPLRTRSYEYGVYADEVLQHYFPPSLAVLTGVG